MKWRRRLRQLRFRAPGTEGQAGIFPYGQLTSLQPVWSLCSNGKFCGAWLQPRRQDPQNQCGFTGCGKNRLFRNGNEGYATKTTCADKTNNKVWFLATFLWKIGFPAIIRCGGSGRWWIAG